MGQAKKKKALRAAGELLKLNLACGQHRLDGFRGVDKVKTEATDQVVDLLKFPWPWKDGSVEEVLCSHFAEHIPLAETPDGTDLFIAFMNELHRILVPGGKATIVTPWWASVRAWQDPTHRRPITDVTYCYFNKEWRGANKLDHYPITADFDATVNYVGDAAVFSRAEEVRQHWMRHYINTINDLSMVLTKR